MRYQFLRFPEGRGKAVTLSYDDGCQQDLAFSDLISKYGLKCTFNLNSEAARSKPLTREEVEERFLARGHEIAVHGYWHRAEGSLRPIEGIRDVLDCRLELEKRYRRIIRGMAYPDFGIRRFTTTLTDYQKIKQYLTELDIVYCRTLGKDNNDFELPADWHCWMPTAHHNNPKIFEYIDQFHNINFSTDQYVASRYPRLFYLWGHSFELDRDNTWDRMEEICQRLSGHDDVWYATNMEIYEYVNAYSSLIYSADGTIICNPTRLDIWLDIDGKPYTVHAGETLYIQA